MKKLAIFICTACILASSSANAAETGCPTEDGAIKKRPTKEEIIAKHKEREAAFEKKLGLTDEQKAKAKELRIEGHKRIMPVIEQIKQKKQEAKMVKMSRMAVQMQEEKLAEIDKELAVLEKQAAAIKKQNMKDFESILTRKQKRILKDMKKEGRKKFEREHNYPKPPCLNK